MPSQAVAAFWRYKGDEGIDEVGKAVEGPRSQPELDWEFNGSC